MSLQLFTCTSQMRSVILLINEYDDDDDDDDFQAATPTISPETPHLLKHRVVTVCRMAYTLKT